MLTYLKKYDRRLWLLASGWFVSAAGFSISVPFIALYFHSELGLTLTEIGLYFGVTAIIRASTQALAGELSDRLGRYSLMVMAQFIRGMIFFVMSYAIYTDQGFLVLGILLILNAMFGAIFQPAAQAAVADIVKSEERTEAYALTRIAGNLGWAIGPAIGGLMAASSYSMLFIFSGIMTLVSGLIIAKYLKGLNQLVHNNEPFRIMEMFTYKGNELMFKLAGIIFILYLVFAQLIAPFSLYSVDLIGITEAQLGILFTLNGLMVALFQFPTSRLLGRFKLTTQLIIGAIIYGCGYFLVGFATTFVFFIITMIIITMGENCVSPPALSLTANLAPEGKTGRYMGIYGFAVTFGWSLGPMIGGTLLDWSKPNYIYMWSTIAALAIVSAVGFKLISAHIPDKANNAIT